MLPQLSPLSVSLCTPDLIPSQRIWWIWGKVILTAALWPSARQLKSSISTMYRAPACSGRRQARGWVAAMHRFQAERGNLTLSSPNPTPPALVLPPPPPILPHDLRVRCLHPLARKRVFITDIIVQWVIMSDILNVSAIFTRPSVFSALLFLFSFEKLVKQAAGICMP